MQLKDVGEFGLINHLTRNLRSYDSSVVLGIGDDAAAFKVTEGSYVLVSCDMLIEGRHFIFDKIKPAELGYKALAVNLSDIAAMGGIPRHALISVGWPDYVDLAYTEQVYNGFQEIAEIYGINILGGDTVKAPQLVLDVTAIGESKRPPITRKGAKAGDVIAVTGRVGASAAGLELLTGDCRGCVSEDVFKHLITAHLKPVPRVKEAGVLAETGGATAMIDISDGVASEVNHICAGSNVGALVYADKLPIDNETRLAGEALKKDCLQWALYGGEDYELLVTLPAGRVAAVSVVLGKMGVDFSVIGEMVDKINGITIMSEDVILPLKSRGYNHFGGDLK
ncbi:MAG: thiamine-phosphate kinase [Dethiobacter sp.]|nr:thiamine-phosphate kinase [Dethiobacter sp.]